MIGATIDQYRITERLGGGGMGDVYRATDLELDREVAIKCVRADLSDIGDVTRRFRAEARTLARLSHPNIATVFRFFSQDAQLFLVMEFIAGTHFGSMLRKAGPLPADRALALLSQALDGLGYAHTQKVVHRDIKPGNLMVDGQGTVKVLDFGIAHVLDSTRMTRTGGIVGTPAYMAPEQALGQPIDHRTDLYSLGIVLYEMLTGTLPFEANSDFELMRAHVEVTPRPLTELSASLPGHLQYTISRALAKDTAERFQSAEEFADALRTPSGETTVAVSRPEPAPAPAPLRITVGTLTDAIPEPLRPYLRPALVGTAAALLVGAGVWLISGRRGPPPADGAAVTAPAPLDPVSAEPATATSVAESTGGAATRSDAGAAEASADAASARPSAARPSAPASPSSAAAPAATPPAPTSEPVSAARLAGAPAPQARPAGDSAPAPLPPPSVRVLKIAVHERQGTGRFSRAAGYNGDFSLSLPGGDRRRLQVDEMLEVRQGGRQVLRQLVTSELRKPGVFQSKHRVPALKQLTPGVYDLRLVFVAKGQPIGHHDWKLEVD